MVLAMSAAVASSQRAYARFTQMQELEADKVGIREEDGKRIRFFKSNSKAID